LEQKVNTIILFTRTTVCSYRQFKINSFK
jgi:hypothetical protein